MDCLVASPVQQLCDFVAVGALEFVLDCKLGNLIVKLIFVLEWINNHNRTFVVIKRRY